MKREERREKKVERREKGEERMLQHVLTRHRIEGKSK
jgi:hypothetical protein